MSFKNICFFAVILRKQICCHFLKLFCMFIYFKKFLLLFNYSCLHFLPMPPPHPSQTHLPPHRPPWFCPCVLYSSSCKPLSPPSPPHSPVAIVRLFLTSMSLVIFCLLFSFVDYVPVKGEINCPLTQQFLCWDYTLRTLKHHPKEPMHPNVHSSTIYNSQVLEAT